SGSTASATCSASNASSTLTGCGSNDFAVGQGIALVPSNGSNITATAPPSTPSAMLYVAQSAGATNSNPVINISSMSETGNVVTVQTASAHGLAVGNSVFLSGSQPSGYNSPSANSPSPLPQAWQVASVPDSTHFTFYDPTAGLPAPTT